MGSSPGCRSVERAMSAIPLPDELVAETLEYLPYASLWSAASVSRQFYSVAWPAGLYIPTTLDCTTWARSELGIHAKVKLFNEVLEHALRKDLRLSLTVVFQYRFKGSDPPYDREAVPKILLAVTAALPVLVALSVTTPDDLSAQISAALRHPAPRLRSLVLSGLDLDASFGKAGICPADFLAGYAPRLCELDLSNTTLGREPIPAFSNVIRLNLQRDASTTHIPQHFPRLAIFSIIYDPAEVSTAPPRAIDCDGAALRRLVFHDQRLVAETSTRPCLQLNDPPELRYLCEDVCMDWTQPLGWRKDGGALSVRLYTDGLRAGVTVVSGDRSWRRSYSINSCDDKPRIRLHRMPGVVQSLAYLRIDAKYLLCLMKGLASYPVLQCVRVDVCETNRNPFVWCPVETLVNECDRGKLWRHQAASNLVRCPALKTLSLVATAPTVKRSHSDRRTNVRYADVEFLRYALSPLAYPVLELVAINVMDCIYDGPGNRYYSQVPILSRIFSAIHQHPFPGPVSGAHLENGLWGEDSKVLDDYSLPICLPKPYSC